MEVWWEVKHQTNPLGKKYREGKGLAGGLLGILFVSAVVLPVGISIWAAISAQLPKHTVKDAGISLEDPTLAYHDCTKEDIEISVAQLRPFPTNCAESPLTYAGYKYHPVTYLFCELDKTVPIAGQKAMVANSGVEFRTESVQSGHSPFVNMPEAVLNAVKNMI